MEGRGKNKKKKNKKRKKKKKRRRIKMGGDEWDGRCAVRVALKGLVIIPHGRSPTPHSLQYQPDLLPVT